VGDALRAHLHHRSTGHGAQPRIAAVYLDLTRYLLDAREGMLQRSGPEL
jgi:hypothetical protein